MNDPVGRQHAASPHCSSTLQRCNVLIVEDNPLHRLFLENALMSSPKLQVGAVEDGFNGLLWMVKNKPEVVVSDLDMPGFGGLQMIRILKDDPVYRNTRIIAVSGLTHEAIHRLGGLPGDVELIGKKYLTSTGIKKKVLTIIDECRGTREMKSTIKRSVRPHNFQVVEVAASPKPEATLPGGVKHSLSPQASPEANQNPSLMLDAVISHLGVKNDAALCRALMVPAPVVSKIRNHRSAVSAALLLRIHEVTDLPVKALRALLQGR